MTLIWTAPGDDSLAGRAARYDLRYFTKPITPQNFLQAAGPVATPLPASPGTVQSCVVDGLRPGAVCYFAIRTADQAGNWSAISNVISRVPTENGIGPAEHDAAAGPGLAFSVPRPNPARDRSSFTCALPEAAPVRIEVFDLLGRRVRLLADESREAGLEELVFDLRDDLGLRLAAGVYLVRARLGSTDFTRRLVIVR